MPLTLRDSRRRVSPEATDKVAFRIPSLATLRGKISGALHGRWLMFHNFDQYLPMIGMSGCLGAIFDLYFLAFALLGRKCAGRYR
jgi:hypothetical protein